MKKLTHIFPILIILLLFGGCKKYEEGPLVSLRNPKNRLVGKWEVMKFYKNDIDSTQHYKNEYGCGVSLNLKIRGDIIGNTYALYNCSVSPLTGPGGGIWELHSDGDYKYGRISFSVIYNTLDSLMHGVSVFNTDTATMWDIKKLSNKHFNIETLYRGNKLRVELEKRE